MWAPPPYPRIPHLFRTPGVTRDDRVLSATESDALLHSDLLIEEKLDGANVMLWIDESQRIQVAGRAGPGALDRAGQLGPLRSWVAEHEDRLRTALQGEYVLYAEWLWLAHSVPYVRLPSYLIVIDAWNGRIGFTTTEGRNVLCARTGLTTPPVLFKGVPRTQEALQDLFGQSSFGDTLAEGLILRDMRGKVAKLLSPLFSRLPDEAWRTARPRNRLRESISEAPVREDH
jgi:hypothetical protein